MKNKIFIFLSAAAIAVGGFTGTKLFAVENSTPAPLRGKIMQRVAEKLNLTEAQRSQIREIFASEKDRLQPVLTRLHDARKNLRDAIHATSADENAVRAASAKVADAEADLAVERMKVYGKIAPVLTDEQRQKISEFEQRADEFAEHAIARVGSGLDN